VRAARPDVALTGDIMVGFPGETEADFQRTLAEIEAAGFMDLHVFRYSPRPRTAATRYAESVPLEEGRRRSRAAIDLGHRLGLDYRRRFEGRRLAVIWDRVLGASIRGFSENYIQVTAPAIGRRPAELEEIVWRTASSAV